MKALIHFVSVVAVFTVSASSSLAAALPDAPARILSRSEPIFPPELAKTDISGRVVVEVTVGFSGEPTSPCVIEITRDEFADAATECVKKWKFSPAIANGRPTISKIRVPIIFANPKSKEPNQALQPTPMSVTSPAAQEPRRP
jgi:TonB family protein